MSAEGPVRLDETSDPAEVEIELFRVSLQSAWLLVYLNLSIALLLGIVQISQGGDLRPALYGFIARCVASMVASAFLLPVSLFGADWMRAHRPACRVMLTLPDVAIMAVAGVTALAYLSADDRGESARIVVMLGAAAAISGVLAPRIMAALPIGRLLVFLPPIVWLLAARPPLWGMLLGLALASLAVSLAISAWVYVQALRGADTAVRLRMAHERSRDLAERLAQSLAIERQGAERIRIEGLLRERFVHAVTHDLRQSLSALRLHGRAAARSSPDPDLKALAAILEDSLASADATIESVAQAAWLAQTEPQDLRPVALGPMLAGVLREVAPLAAEAGIALTAVPTTAAVRADGTALERSLRNLVYNALRHSGGRRLLLGVRRRGEEIGIVVADDGRGIPLAAQEHVFDRFYQGPARSERPAGSMGLGLATVRELVTRMGGRVTLDSAPGRGTRFEIRLPAAPAPPACTDPGVVLILDDEAESREAIRSAAEANGWRTLAAATAAEARALPEADAYLFDFFLGDRETALDVLATFTPEQKARTLVVSAYVPEALSERLRQEGVACTSKPLSRARLGQFLEGLSPAASEQPVLPRDGHGLHAAGGA